MSPLSGSPPAHPDPFARDRLGWIVPDRPSSRKTNTARIATWPRLRGARSSSGFLSPERGGIVSPEGVSLGARPPDKTPEPRRGNSYDEADAALLGLKVCSVAPVFPRLTPRATRCRPVRGSELGAMGPPEKKATPKVELSNRPLASLVEAGGYVLSRDRRSRPE